ncbi:N-acetylmuramoyl-L-alanine amidase [Paenibacillus tritici]|uniref:N-acetylmuramoyl-L-alanine amidase n=1 Tax=Paenibacillus tritici TaxID=1873425 RepID=A0ABX2DV36_9BACL|nr:N-acetylmuramoyl-L-alanine amidase [Paenibacillus tritici]NQX48564.1 N-acetylmuramoyl-L-alanine amidase [Paenibacillus tritici]QUL54313.1 N-acetylmuramoyl-L-alanine amidase [Paenibacillus tritici]
MRKKIHTAVLAACLLTSSLLPVLPSSPAYAASGYTAKVYANSLNVRSEPAASATITGTLAGGALVTVTEDQHGWLKVRAGSVSGWVAGYYLKRTSGSSSASTSGSASAKAPVRTSAVSSGTAVVTASSLRMRGGAGTGYEVVGSLQSGNKVTILSRQGEWTRVRAAGGTVGWVASQYLSGGTARNLNTAASNTQKVSVVRKSGSIRGKLIIVDPGHGGLDPGMLGTTYNTMEKDLTLQTSLYLRDYLSAKGARVEMTRTRGDQKPSFSRRVQLGQQLGADAFVSIHYNSSPKNVSGTLTFFYSEQNDIRLARAIETRLGQGIGLRSNGLSFGNYHILRENPLPSTLVELGFLSNPYDESIVRKAAYQRKAAQAVADGVADYFNN